MAHIAIIGATGRAGSQLLEEAVRRGHTVSAIARHASSKLAGRDGVSPVDTTIGFFLFLRGLRSSSSD